MRLRLALFDVDGTLVDSQGQILSSMQAAFDAIQRPLPPRETVLAQVGLSLPLVVRNLAPDADHGAMEAAYKARFQTLRGQAASTLYPGIRAMLDALAARDTVLTGVATGKSRRGLTALIEEHGLRMATAQCADDHPSKPHPSMIEAALGETGVAARDAVMIGDTSYDMEMARAAGVFALGVSWGYHAADLLRDAGADAVVDTADALLPALDRLWGASDG